MLLHCRLRTDEDVSNVKLDARSAMGHPAPKYLDDGEKKMSQN